MNKEIARGRGMTKQIKLLLLSMGLLAAGATCAGRGQAEEPLPAGVVGRLELKCLSELAFTPDGSALAVATEHGVLLYGVSELEQTRSFTLSGNAYSLAFSPDGRLLAAGSYSAIYLWDFETGDLVSTLEGSFGNVYALAFTPDRKGLLSGASDGSVTLWDLSEEEPVWAHKAHSGSVRGVAVSPDGTRYASGSMDQGILWNRSGEVLFTFPGKAWCTAFSPDSYFLAVGAGKVVKLWDTAVGLCYRSMWRHTGCVWWVEFSPSGQFLASASLDHTVRLWDPEEGECLAVLAAHDDSVECVRFSPDGRLLASGSGDGTVFLWDLSNLLEGRGR